MRPSFLQRLLAPGALLLATAAAAQAPACRQPPPARLVERFVPADCEGCWSAAQPLARPAGTLVLDWIVPAGDDAPMAAAALPDATRRAGRLPGGRTAVRETRLHPGTAPRLRIVDGPAWNGYIGLRLLVTRHSGVPRGALAYAALVEHVPAGNEGSPVERNVVRALAGPMGLEELASQTRIEHLRAVAVPRGGREDRLASVAWIEAPDGRVITAVHSPPPECR